MKLTRRIRECAPAITEIFINLIS